MNSKEALERLLDDYEYLMEKYYPIRDIRNQQINNTKNNVNQIKQSLDRLEKLEKENKELLVNKNVAQGIATKLKEENDTLRQTLQTIRQNSRNDYIKNQEEEENFLLSKCNELQEENTKLKKTIKVFVGYILVCKPIDFDTYLHSLCDDTEIKLITELLKEVLE